VRLEKKLDVPGELYWFDRETGREYGNVVGGLGWPGSKDGCLVVAGVGLTEDTDLEAFPIQVLGETVAEDLDQLLRTALKLKDQFSIGHFYGDLENMGMMALLDEFNGDRRKRGLSPLDLYSHPQDKESGRLSFYLQLIKKLTRPNRKILSFGPESILPGYLLSLSPEEASKATINNHPIIAAMGYALAVLTAWRPRKEPREQTAKIAFDPFTHDQERPSIFTGGRVEGVTDYDPFREG
jgi:hypothetical protein